MEKELNEMAKAISKDLSVSIQGNNYYVFRGIGPIDFVELLHFKRPMIMSDLWCKTFIHEFLAAQS